MAMEPDRIQAAIDVSGWLEWIIRRISALAMAIMAVSVCFNFGKSALLHQAGAALLAMALLNVLATRSSAWLAH